MTTQPVDDVTVTVTVTFERGTQPDDDMSPTDYLFKDPSYRAEDQMRLDAFHRGDWHFVGICAVAHLTITRNGYGTLYTMASPGIWGVESDSDSQYLDSIYRDEVANLRADIERLQTYPIHFTS